MPSKRTLIVIVAVGLLLLGVTPHSVSAAITGNTYNFSAVWSGETYEVEVLAIEQSGNQTISLIEFETL